MKLSRRFWPNGLLLQLVINRRFWFWSQYIIAIFVSDLAQKWQLSRRRSWSVCSTLLRRYCTFFPGLPISVEAALSDIPLGCHQYVVTSSSFQSWWVLFTCRILLRRTLWRISAAVCTSPLPSRIISRWNEDALRTAYKMKPSGRDSLGHSAPAAWASTKVSLKIQLLRSITL